MGATLVPQQTASLQLLTLLDWGSLSNWSVHFALESSFAYNPDYSLYPIGSLLHRTREEVVIQDNELYQQVTVRMNGQGVIPRSEDLVKGQDIGTKRQFRLRAGQFVMSRIDARHGAVGIAPKNLDGAILTNDFPAYNINRDLVNPQFFALVTGTDAFIRFCRNCSTGTTNRQRLDEALFLDVHVPVPPLGEQARLVAEYNERMQTAFDKRNKAEKVRANAEASFLYSLGLELPRETKKEQGWHFIESQHLLDRWDYFASNGSVDSGLVKAKYLIRTLGTAYNFVSRGWSGQKTQEKTFRYVEISSIEPDLGITGAKLMNSKEAPSRASQIIHTGDLLIATTRPYLKKFAIVTPEFDGCICSSGFSVISVSDDYDIYFLREFLFSVYGINQIRDRMTGALYPAITDAGLKSIRIPLPSTAKEQRIIIEEVERKRADALQLESEAADLELVARKTFEETIFA